MRRATQQTLLVLLVALSVSGCGGSEADSDGWANERTAQAPEPAQTTPRDTSPTAEMRARLEAAGYTVEEGEIPSDEPRPDGTLDVVLGASGEVTIYLYSSPADVAKAEVAFDPVVRSNPDQIEVRSVGGRNVYVGTIEEPAKLPLAKFNRLVAAAEG